MGSIPFIKGDKADSNTDYRDALPVNYYAVLRDIYGEEGYLLNYYGISSFATGEGISRGATWVSSVGFEGQYRVSGQSLIKIDDSGNSVVLGSIIGTDQASLTYSLNNLAIVADGRLYYYNPTDGLRLITADNVGTPIDIVWADFRFVLTDGEFLYQSDLTSEELFEPLDFSGSDFQPDRIVGVGLNEDNELVAFNVFSTEYFVNSGADNFSYTRISLKAVKSGIIGTHCKAEFKDQWFCLTRRAKTQPQFSIIQSGSAKSFATREVEKILAAYTDEQLATTVIEVFTKDSITWMIAHLPRETLAYNHTLAEASNPKYAWSILKSDVVGTAFFRGKDAVYDPRFSRWIVGDRRGSNIGYLDDSQCTHYGEIVEGLLHSQALDLEGLSIDEFSIETLPGNSPNDDASVFISRSDDLRVNGMEWAELYGENFNYNTNFIARRLGYVRQSVTLKIRTASTARMSFCKFNIEAS